MFTLLPTIGSNKTRLLYGNGERIRNYDEIQVSSLSRSLPFIAIDFPFPSRCVHNVVVVVDYMRL